MLDKIAGDLDKITSLESPLYLKWLGSCSLICTLFKFFRGLKCKIQFKHHMDKYRELMKENKISEGYNALQKIDISFLSPKNQELLNIKRFECLVMLGNLKAAGEIEKTIKNSDEIDYILEKSQFLEMKGNFKESREILLAAMGKNIESKETKARLLNNLGRKEFRDRKYQLAIDYYEKGIESLGTEKSSVKDILYANLIETYLINGETEKSQTLFEEYKKIIDLSNEENRVFFNNLKLNLARQSNFTLFFSEEEVHKEYAEIMANLSGNKRFIFEISSLRLAFNSNYDLANIIQDIEKDFENYFKLPAKERYYVFKELGIVVKEDRTIFKESLSLRVENYLKEDAEKDLEIYKKSLDTNEVFQKCLCFNEIVGVKKNYHLYDSEKIVAIMDEVLRVYKDNELRIREIEQRLNIVDECMDSRNIEMKNGRVSYFHYSMRIKENLETLKEDLKKLELDSETAVFYLRAAYYFLAQGDKDSARIYYEKFKMSKMCVDHYALWIKKYYEGLGEGI